MKMIKLQKGKKVIVNLVKAVFIIGFCFVILQPLVVMISKAFMGKADIFDNSVVLVPREWTLFNMEMAIDIMDYWKSLGNTFLLAGVAALVTTFTSMCVGYGLARFDFRGRNLIMGLVIFTIIIPPQLIMVPLYMRFRFFDIFGIIEMITGKPGINLLDSFVPFYLLAFGCMGIKNGIFIYMFRQFFRGVPKETEEAAMIDGANAFRIFRSVMIPPAKTMIITVGLFSFVWQYNDTVYANLFLQNVRVLSTTYSAFQTLSVNAVYDLDAWMKTEEYIAVLKSTGVLLLLLPVLIIYLIMQKHFVDGIERSGLVG